MQMIRAILRPETTDKTVRALDKEGFPALTKFDVTGRGKQKGIQHEDFFYDELPKKMIMLVVDDDNVDDVINIITDSAVTGNFGDGKVFVSPVDEVYTVRTRSKGI
ncbi:nitrogen regulatory protein P-II [Methanobrevibacter cuticularis]|uniref:Nitrogen regulatory protein P-II n=1 Tax=Methanobrevibacter cuticularis TaxID=47311 RepID=A0A166DFN3_9EURY|nr:P-II family nitrogen regulator [Methanobrevibacter cuticularis]KZX15551.1 nitrogen regulatory protein P-II [Methanobrevibacter cuticularis]